MVAMTAEKLGLLAELPDDRPLTVEDLDLLPDDGNKYELDDGVLVVSPAPAFNHQVVVTRLTVALTLQAPQGFLVVGGPGVERSRSQYRIPDIVAVRVGDVEYEDKSIVRPPVLAIEVASPSTAAYDRNRKRDVYAGFGIASCWIVKPDLEKPGITAFELRRGTYREVAEVTGDEVFKPTRPFPCEIVPSALVAGPWRI
ncbi:MAG TPA: Uma2 family endonuclease [Streptosporangiaceae bacterium]|nr:Uma2 family endonuclease [Streptosporangiaceae bacterium]